MSDVNVGRRLRLSGPQRRDDVPWWKTWGGHGGDEYGNCTVYFTCLLFGITLWWDPHLQFDVEVPYCEDGESVAAWQRWYDRKFNGMRTLI